MDGRTLARRLVEVAALVCPLAIGPLAPPPLLPPPLAFVLARGWWLAAAGLAANDHVHGLGLPALLTTAVGLTAPEETSNTIPRGALTVMALVFALACVETARLAWATLALTATALTALTGG